MKNYRFVSMLSTVVLGTVATIWVNAAEGTNNVMKVAISEGHLELAKIANYKHNVEDHLSKIYSDAGIDVEFIYLPNERAIQSVLSGQFDALGMRVDGLEKESNLIKVNVPLGTFDVYLLSKGEKFFNSLEEVEVKDETIVALYGARFVDVLKHYKRLHLVYSNQQAALMLVNGSVTLWLAPFQSYQLIKNAFPDIKISSPSLSQENVYHYIHPSKVQFLEQLEKSARHHMQSQQ